MSEQDERQLLLFGEDNTYLVRLEGFEGPLELLLLLIRKHKYDIYDIPIAAILKEYLGVIEEIQKVDIDLAGEFLVMAATLAQIKSRMLIPKHLEEEAEEGEDPRAELVRRLLEYERFREAAKSLSDTPRLGRDVFTRSGPPEGQEIERPEQKIEADLFNLLLAFKEVLKEASEEFIHEVSRHRMTTQEAMTELLERFSGAEKGDRVSFRSLFTGAKTKDRLIALFMGLLELVRMRAIKVEQPVAFGEIIIVATPAEED
ncbi:MAG: segregation/condensation protein A [Deltaproteobacteria bacterium]|nr:MAG: segregation/condensation protein A [Deltaproteobacteria bacterium]